MNALSEVIILVILVTTPFPLDCSVPCPMQAKIDYAVGVIINLLQLSSRPVTMVGGVADRMTKNQKIATGGAIALAGLGVVAGLMALAVPVALVAIFFLPVTVIGGVSRG